ncbi:MAG TPA: RagB/SusD family nutrient uptake outer membrane protein, partial [Sunxiuqinia sp.]|nr:RagB/SusD family nutrient uptake outer membrane protein [Sunxiuqinia sp.]
MKNKIFKINLLVLLAFALGSCTNLDEELYGRLSPDTYYSTQEEALSSVVGVYQKFSTFANIGDVFRPEEFGTDEFFVPGRASGGWFSQDNIDIMHHEPKANNGTIQRAWNYVFPMIGTANAVIESLESSPSADKFKGLIAETKAMRAYGYFYAMDLWGNIPIFTAARVDPNNLPATNSRQEVFDFVVTEMKAAAQDLPSVNDVDRASYYPRLTKEAVYSALAMIYLNAEVYTETAHWSDVIDMCDNVISSNAFSLQPSVGDVFLSTNENNSEVITAFSMDPTKNAGNNQFILYTNPALDKLKYNLPFSPADGYSTDTTALNRYEDIDDRKSLIEYGPQFYLDGTTPLADADGNQLVLIPLKSLTSAEDNEGFKVMKYSPIGA